MSKIKFVIFDMDGLVLDTERLAYESFLRGSRECGFQFNQAVHMDIAGGNERQIAAELRRIYGPDKDVEGWRTCVLEKKAELMRARAGHAGKKPGLLELLCFLHEREVPYVLASSTSREGIEERLGGEYLLHDFPLVVDGSQVRMSKPDPDIFLRAARLIGAAPAETLVLEDSRAGIRAANAGGFVSGFVFDDLSDMGEVADGYPILVDLEDPTTMGREACVSFDSLAEVVDALGK